VKQAQDRGFRSRAAFKLIEIEEKARFLKAGHRVVDLGAAPGGWSQVAASKVLPGGMVVAIDLVEIAPISGVMVLKGDFRESGMHAKLIEALGSGKADVLLSDLSPNITGIQNVDQARAAELVQSAMMFCREILKPEGVFLVKVFQGEAFSEVLEGLRANFVSVQMRKPAASRGESREAYFLARGLKLV